MVEPGHHPRVPPPQLGTYRNAAVARAAQSVAAPPHYGSSSSNPSRPGESDHGAPPWRDQYPQYPSPSSASIWGHQRPRRTAGATAALEPSRADPPSPRQECAAKRAARRYPQTPQHHLGSTTAPPQGATSGDRGNPAPPTYGENLRPEEPPSAADPQPVAAPSITRRCALHDPVPTRKRHHPLNPPRTGPEIGSHHDSPAQPTTPETPINRPATGRASALASAPARNADAPTPRSATGPIPQHHSHKGQHCYKLCEGHNASSHGPTDCRTDRRQDAGSHKHSVQHATGTTWPGGPPTSTGSGQHRCAAQATNQPKTGPHHGEH